MMFMISMKIVLIFFRITQIHVTHRQNINVCTNLKHTNFLLTKKFAEFGTFFCFNLQVWNSARRIVNLNFRKSYSFAAIIHRANKKVFAHKTSEGDENSINDLQNISKLKHNS